MQSSRRFIARVSAGPTRISGMKGILSAITVGAFLAGCDLYSQDEFQQEFIVESFMIANERLPSVRLSRSAPFGMPFEFEKQATGGAGVQISLLTDNGDIAEVYFYRERSPGIYEPEDDGAIVLPRREYRLHVDISEAEHELSARAIVPDTFSVARVSADTVIYQSAGQLEVDITRSFYPGRQAYFISSTESLDPANYGLTPFYRSLDEDESEWIVNESAVFNEANFRVNPDETVTLPLPWIAIAFFGPNRISLFALDDNMYDFWRSAQIQGGQSTLSPGEVPNVISNVDGGIGLFAGLARETLEIYVARP